ncbi:MAG: SDR family NAD(P)-dependent oxidoreductase, partial [Myxococcota bacterium]
MPRMTRRHETLLGWAQTWGQHEMKTAVVTGAGKGLGRRIVEGLAGKGFAVLATDVDEEAARATA